MLRVWVVELNCSALCIVL